MVLVHDTSSYCALQLHEYKGYARHEFFFFLKFHFYSFNGCQLTEQTRNSIANDQREIPPKYPKQSYVFVHDTSSYCALQLYEVSSK